MEEREPLNPWSRVRGKHAPDEELHMSVKAAVDEDGEAIVRLEYPKPDGYTVEIALSVDEARTLAREILDGADEAEEQDRQ